ncbi:unnamed protein product, partial [Protopolystoma xenopodis]
TIAPLQPSHKPASGAYNPQAEAIESLGAGRPEDLSRNRKTPLVPGVETVIDLVKKPGKDLGFSIVGGQDTVLGNIRIHEVHENSLAALDGRLWAGDRLLAVNGVDIRKADHETATRIIRSAEDHVRLKVLRDPKPLTEDDLLEVFEVSLDRKAGRVLGLSLVDRPSGIAAPGTIISDVVSNP